MWSGQHLEHNAQRQKPLRALLLTPLPPSKENKFSGSEEFEEKAQAPCAGIEVPDARARLRLASALEGAKSVICEYKRGR